MKLLFPTLSNNNIIKYKYFNFTFLVLSPTLNIDWENFLYLSDLLLHIIGLQLNHKTSSVDMEGQSSIELNVFPV